MKYDIIIHNEKKIVDISKTNSTITVQFNEKKFTFQIQRTSSGMILEYNQKIFHTNLQSKIGSKSTVNVNDHTMVFDWIDPYTIQSNNSSGSNSGEIRAVMPGRVIKVLVTKDQIVEVGQPLLVLEAMKMENEIKAVKSGKITNVHVNETASVETGAILISME